MFRRTPCLLAAVLAAGTAQATPPDVLGIRDELFGVSAAEVFLIRTTSDNLGLHIAGMSDVFLVAKDIATGEDTAIWPVYRSLRTLGDRPDAIGEIVLVLPQERAVNPYDILGAHGGRPASAREDPASADLTSGDLTVTGSDGPRALPTARMLELIARSVALTSDAIQPYPPDVTPGGGTTLSPQERLDGIAYGPQECDVLDRTSVSMTYETPVIELVRIHCSHDGYLDPATLYIIVPPI